MNQTKRHPIRTTIIVILTVILSTVVINAADHIGSFKDSLLGNVVSTDASGCPSGMASIPAEGGSFCIDMYENSADDACQFSDPGNNEETRLNLEGEVCKPVSKQGKIPWRNIARHQAELACAKAGKRLPTNKEWYRAALGTPDSRDNWGPVGCNLGKAGSASPEPAGGRSRCVSSAGVFDMVGNVWEWIDGSIEVGAYKGRTTPSTGFVTSVDGDGVPLSTVPDVSDPVFNDDYFWADLTDVRGMIRGGYWGNDSDAGLYAINAVIPPTFTGIGAGFRCVK
jgi:formylglycine-generating enzyme required for sulfatase activity